MWSQTKKNSVNSFNHNGFTLIEALAALSVFLLIVFFMAPVFQIIMNNNDLKLKNQQMEWDVFCSQMKKEVRMGTKADVLNNSLFLTNGPDTIIYEKNGSNLRRRVNYTGNEIILQNVKEVVFTPLKNAIKVNVIDLMGKEYEVIVYSFIEWI
ncbi:MAG: competence type IV pilus minor pilin ComGF [Bacillota bacterium]|nr:competence type IV pilus minor pilin ComGF [Bacillota bacterium]